MSSPIADRLELELIVGKATFGFIDTPTIIAGLGIVPWSSRAHLLAMARHNEFCIVLTTGHVSVFIPVGGSDVELIAFDIEAAA